MHQAGILEYAVRNSKRTNNPCSIRSKHNIGNGQKSKPILLKLPDFMGAFFILGVGLGLATITIICEFIAKHFL